MSMMIERTTAVSLNFLYFLNKYEFIIEPMIPQTTIPAAQYVVSDEVNPNGWIANENSAPSAAVLPIRSIEAILSFTYDLFFSIPKFK